MASPFEMFIPEDLGPKERELFPWFTKSKWLSEWPLKTWIFPVPEASLRMKTLPTGSVPKAITGGNLNPEQMFLKPKRALNFSVLWPVICLYCLYQFKTGCYSQPSFCTNGGYLVISSVALLSALRSASSPLPFYSCSPHPKEKYNLKEDLNYPFSSQEEVYRPNSWVESSPGFSELIDER